LENLHFAPRFCSNVRSLQADYWFVIICPKFEMHRTFPNWWFY
jgi:hypothetical protein